MPSNSLSKTVSTVAFQPFVAFNATKADADLNATSLSEPFDFYLDAVRFLPDNASIVKVSWCRVRFVVAAEGMT